MPDRQLERDLGAGKGRRPERVAPGMRLSVLDLVPVRSDQTTADALAATRRLARVADETGYHRYWLAEHHNMPGIASAATAVLIAHVAGGTETIRVGAGGIMLPNHAPPAIAEQFGTLESLFPGPLALGGQLADRGPPARRQGLGDRGEPVEQRVLGLSSAGLGAHRSSPLLLPSAPNRTAGCSRSHLTTRRSRAILVQEIT